MTGPTAAFEGRHGLWEQVTGPFEIGALGGRDRPLAIERTNFKFFAAEYHAQAPLALALALRTKVSVEDIEAIDVRSGRRAGGPLAPGDGGPTRRGAGPVHDHAVGMRGDIREGRHHARDHVAAASSRIALGALVSFWWLLAPAWAADVRGRITFSDGRPAASERILLGDTPIGKTDVAGVYWLNLPAGTHTLVVKGQQFRIRVSPNGSRSDIRLK